MRVAHSLWPKENIAPNPIVKEADFGVKVIAAYEIDVKILNYEGLLMRSIGFGLSARNREKKTRSENIGKTAQNLDFAPISYVWSILPFFSGCGLLADQFL